MSERFWDFSVRVYALPGVADALLELQNRHGGDINLVLLCAWHAATGRGPFARERIAALDAAVEPWRERIIKALREVRRLIGDETDFAMLSGSRRARAQVLDAELACEQVAQELLEALTESRPAKAADAFADFEASLGAYGEHLALPPEALPRVLSALRQAF